ncbi:MAG: hypothetical protein CL692_02195 [Cellvibrionales bacterium]|nr:hypothetical protein [Cellvibrionales bacterium]
MPALNELPTWAFKVWQICSALLPHNVVLLSGDNSDGSSNNKFTFVYPLRVDQKRAMLALAATIWQ